MDRQENFKIEEIKERAKFLERSIELFKCQGQILMTCSDCLTYVFDSICEAITFIIHRVKEDEEGIPSYNFKEAMILNIGSPDICIMITTDKENYICKTLESYKYESENEKTRKEQNEIEYILGNSKQRFLDDMKEKTLLIKSEFNSNFNSFDDKKVTDSKMVRMLDRYFGVNGWQRYWFSSRQLSKISVELTLHVLLSGGAIINVPSDKTLSSKEAKLLIKEN